MKTSRREFLQSSAVLASLTGALHMVPSSEDGDRYEYDVLWFSLAEWEWSVKEMNEMSSQSWRVVSTAPVGDSVLVFMEREHNCPADTPADPGKPGGEENI